MNIVTKIFDSIKKNTSEGFWVSISLFFLWRLLLILFLVLSVQYVPLGAKDQFLGGGAWHYQLSPYLFSWANFDGEHYTSIAIYGYKGLEQAFFPIYPKLISVLNGMEPMNMLSPFISSVVVGIFISNIAFLLALIFLWKLIRLDYSSKITFWSILLLVLFPTSFYFGAVYNESLFLLLFVLSLYFARTKNWALSVIFGMVASATRIFGVLLLPMLLIEAWSQKMPYPKMVGIIPVVFGLLGYMFYLQLTIGDPIAFFHLQQLVGEQRSSGFVPLPQVYFRYIKMLLSIDLYNPIFQTVFLEFIVGILFFLLPIYGFFKKMKFSYILYAMAGLLISGSQGSFSSAPRYVLVLFPSFIALSIMINNSRRWVKWIVILIMLAWFTLASMLYLRGYWIA